MNFPILITAAIYMVIKFKHFGFYSHPQSDIEFIADGIFFIILSLGWVKGPNK